MDVSTKTTETATRRLAVCNLDWDRVTATDLFGRQSHEIIKLYLYSIIIAPYISIGDSYPRLNF